MTLDELTQVENQSIRTFISQCAFAGAVLDVGCGREPYRTLIEDVGGTYVGYDRARFPANMSGRDLGELAGNWDMILCTQVVQFVPNVTGLLAGFRTALSARAGTLVLTWPTNWPEVNDTDLHRFTATGMERLLAQTGFKSWTIVRRACFDCDGIELAYGYGAVAHA